MREEIINNLISILNGNSNLINIGTEYVVEIPVRRMIVSDRDIKKLSKIDINSVHTRGYSCTAIDFLIGNIVKTVTNEGSLKAFVEDIDLSEMNYYLVEIASSKSFNELIEEIHRDFKSW